MKQLARPALAVLTLLTFLLPVNAFENGTGTSLTPAQIVARRVARLTTLLSLTPTQQTQATTIFTTEQTTVSGLQTSIDTARTALETAIQNNYSSGISTQAIQIGNLTGQLVLAEATADAAFYAILTSAQQTLYNNVKLGGLVGPGDFGGPHHR
jgi:Spy/CpxP family protein refolding chaperone